MSPLPTVNFGLYYSQNGYDIDYRPTLTPKSKQDNFEKLSCPRPESRSRSESVQKSRPNRFVFGPASAIHQVSWKSVHTFLSNLVDRQTINRQRRNQQKWKHCLVPSAEVTVPLPVYHRIQSAGKGKMAILWASAAGWCGFARSFDHPNRLPDSRLADSKKPASQGQDLTG